MINREVEDDGFLWLNFSPQKKSKINVAAQNKSDTFLIVLGGTAARSIIRWGGLHFFNTQIFSGLPKGLCGKLGGDACRSQYRVAHTVEKLFVIWAQGGEGAATGDGVLVGEVVWTEPHSRSHGLEFRHAGQSVFRFEELSLMEGLQDAWLVSEFGESCFEFGFPFVLGMIRSDHDASRAPRLFGKPTDFENEIPLLLTESADFSPGVGLEAWQNGMAGQGSGIEEPRVGDGFLQGQKGALA